ncbi:prepilin-type N-terminal cleavage/methylation domain-containing protein [Polyangium sp. 6x1]|uniref:prepilin-type N-terminal cleavage/methylation domain-containing protein n=1 Tax=Polyangium sp. 6x1 TaxID=3042689 RepID=UPI00248213CD|nr:prepilin-type N-terminal cleavage/methylation domain-containing protein [Polyangium sp. 6x1]MDI1445476.1 prepilin-type N-terminal cleavage/methylation domain-containing protein [Polyangium sp. 6x1]
MMVARFLSRRLRRARTAGAATLGRGFTLTEILVVIFMIALLAAVASPAFIRIMRDIGLSRLTMQLAEIYRRGYVESSERATYLVRFRKPSGNLQIETVRAALDTPTPTLISPRGCNTINWDDPALERQTFRYAKTDKKTLVDVGFLGADNSSQEIADVCFARRTAFVRYNDGAFVQMVGATKLSVTNLGNGRVRRVLVPSFGLPRVIQ